MFDHRHIAAMQQNKAALGYATRLACSIWGKHYRQDSPNWQPSDHLMGVLTQIDNMVSGMSRTDGVTVTQPAEFTTGYCDLQLWEVDRQLAATGEEVRYWLCCGSQDHSHQDARAQSCVEANTGHPERCRFGTAAEHSEWQRNAGVSVLDGEVKSDQVLMPRREPDSDSGE